MTYAETYAEEYLGKIFYYCLKKTGNEDDAGDLASDISCEILSSLHRGTVPEKFDSWVWKIASNRFKRWAKEKWYGPESDHADLADFADILPDSTDIEESLVLSEDMGLMRRELAFIRSDYRNVLISHYFGEKSVSEIAREFGLPLGTVKTKLQNSRKMLKEGMNMAREFGKRSYNPEQVSFVMSGRDGKCGQPWAILNHLLYKNIFLEASENPLTAEELSLELGIALPYMEDELAFLVREQLLRKDENKYVTDFPIVSREEQKRQHEENLKIAEPLTEKLCELADTYMKEDGVKVNADYVGYETAKWALLMRIFDYIQYDAHENAKTIGRKIFGPYPDRPDEGAWVVTGYETTDFDEPAFVGQHGYTSHDREEVKTEIDFSQFKFYTGNHQAKTPMYLTYKEAETLWYAVHGRLSEAEDGYIEKMLSYGYLKKVGDEILPNVVVFDRNAEKPDNAELSAKLASLKNEIVELFRQAPSIERGYVVEEAVKNGWLTFSDDLIPTAGAFIYQ